MIDRVRWAEHHLEYRFNDSSLLEQALTHRSASRLNNERLEFLGDSLLNFTITCMLYERRPEDSEGDLSRARAALVNRHVLAEIGRRLGIDSQLELGPGERRAGGAQRGAALADALEALIGAVLLDGGRDAAETLVQRLFSAEIDAMPVAAELKDPKTRLQEWLQGRGLGLPRYTVDTVEGKDHQRSFTVVCSVEHRGTRTRGSGSSRRVAEQEAAAAMLAALAGE